MLPEFPETRKKIDEFLVERFRTVENQSLGIFSEIKYKHQFEGHAQRVFRQDGSVEETDFKRITADSEPIDARDIATMSLSELLESFDRVALEVARQKAEVIFKGINDATERAGTAISADGQAFSIDLFFSMIERMEIDFDEQGQAILPSLIVAPAMGDQLAQVNAIMETDPVAKQRYDELMKTKKEEWIVRESSRKLVG